MKFFKVSKKTPQKTTTYIRYSDGPEGNKYLSKSYKVFFTVVR